MKLQIGIATQEQDIAAETAFINVPYRIVEQLKNEDGTDAEGVEVLFEAAQAFPLGTSTEDITAAMTQTLEVYKAKHLGAEESRAAQEAIDSAGVVTGEISNITIGE